MHTLYDNHGRPLNYLRLAVTDRCNLRCFYCMPEQGINYLPKKELLSFEEIIRIVNVFASMGIRKIRFTGGEPFVRTDLMKLITAITEVPGISEWHITTNGILTAPYIDTLKKLGIGSVNLSLDTLDRQRFKIITRKDEFDQCKKTLDQLIENGIRTKVNFVVMDKKNIDDILPMVELTKHKNISVRFIEEMPFNGSADIHPIWNYNKIINHIRSAYSNLTKIQDPENTTAYHYHIPGYAGTIGIIAAFSRTFCGTCNRLRLTAQGQLKTCLYDQGVLDLKSFLRRGISDDDLRPLLLKVFSNRPRNGFEAEAKRSNFIGAHESMSTIGG